MTIWEELASQHQPFLALAPMEDVTDVVFRAVVARAAKPNIFFTEFMNVNGFCHEQGRAQVARRLETSPTDTPIIAQIWGNEPEKFALTAVEIAKMGKFAGLDINMGCPDKAVVRSGGGSALILQPALAKEVISAAKQGGLPVSVKTRLGYSQTGEWRDWLNFLLQQNLTCLTVHLRTKKEMSKVAAHTELIPEIVKLRGEIAPQTKLMINGDIADARQGARLAEKYPGVDGVMIGRGVFLNPFCFEQKPQPHSRDELIGLLQFHLSEFDKHESKKFDPLKRFFKIYVNGFPGASSLRSELMQTKNTAEVRDIIDAWTKSSQKL
ncbi:MAG: tRNA-dihydrouridine synthase [Candidatus Nomurabacteria bacterium]|jgi:tRNA-dihydrouridine synthase|nr:tRNA-dihydrouridine synthase [Candidatus Nomurabacteria bacterium]